MGQPVAAEAVSSPSPGGFAFWKDVVVATVRTFMDPDTSPRCAATAFFGFLSIFPALATAFLVYGLVADTRLLVETIDVLDALLPDSAVGILREQLDMLAAQSRGTLGIGLLISVPLALWSGSRGVNALLFAMSRVRTAPEKRNFVLDVLYAVGFTLVGSVFLIVSLVTVAGLPAMIPFPNRNDLLLLLIRWPILMAVTMAVLLALYRFGPDRHPRRLRYVWPGALLASTLWIMVGALFSLYVENWGNYNETFGSVSAAVVLLLWIYNSAQIFVLGAAFNSEIERGIEPSAPLRAPEALAVQQLAINPPAPSAPVPKRNRLGWPLALFASGAWFVGTLAYDRFLAGRDRRPG